MKYEEPKMSLLFFNTRDIIRTSDDEIIGGGLGGEDIGDGGGSNVNGRSRTSF